MKNRKLDETRRTVVRAFELHLSRGGTSAELFALLGYFLELLIEELSEPMRSRALTVLHRRICEGKADEHSLH